MVFLEPWSIPFDYLPSRFRVSARVDSAHVCHGELDTDFSLNGVLAGEVKRSVQSAVLEDFT